MKRITFLSLLVLLFSCSEKESPQPVAPTIQIVSAYSANEVSALARGTLIAGENTTADAYGIVWSTDPLPDISDRVESIPFSGGDGDFSLQLYNVELGQTYYVRAFVRRGEEIIYTDPISFTHQGPFVWRQLSSVKWSDRQHSVSSVAWFGNIYVLRPVSQLETEAWQYVPEIDQWFELREPDLPAARYDPLLINLNKFGDEATFLSGGYVINESLPQKYVYLKDCFRYDIRGGGKGDDYFDFPFGYSPLTHFVIDNRAYVISMDSRREVAEFWNGVLWNKKSNFPGPFLGRYVAFSAANKGYALVESTSAGTRTQQLYEYDPENDTWTRKADFPGEDRMNGVAFSVRGKGYYGIGQSKDRPQGLRDLWQYDPQTDTWQKYADFPGNGHVRVIANTVSNRAFLGLGYQIRTSAAGVELYQNAYDYWEFVPE
jgi:hypothetical protein